MSRVQVESKFRMLKLGERILEWLVAIFVCECIDTLDKGKHQQMTSYPWTIRRCVFVRCRLAR